MIGPFLSDNLDRDIDRFLAAEDLQGLTAAEEIYEDLRLGAEDEEETLWQNS